MSHDQVRNLPDEHKEEITRALNDAEKIFSSSSSMDEYKKRIGLKKTRLQNKEGQSSDPSYYLMTMNTLHKTPDDWYHPVSGPDQKSTRIEYKPKTKTSAHSLAELRIKQDMVNAGLDPESHDVSSLMDRTLNYKENRANVAKQLGYSYTEKEKKEAKQRVDHHQCISAQERCEVHNDKVACKEYRESGCNKVYGDLEI